MVKKSSRFDKGLWIIFGVLIMIAIFDFFQYPKSFWLFSFLAPISIGGFYFLITRDFSDSLALFSAFFVLLMFGLEDLIFFLIRPLFQPEFVWGLPALIPNLDSHVVIGNLSKFLGFGSVTGWSLVISVFIGVVITVVLVSVLRKIRG